MEDGVDIPGRGADIPVCDGDEKESVAGDGDRQAGMPAPPWRRGYGRS